MNSISLSPVDTSLNSTTGLSNSKSNPNESLFDQILSSVDTMSNTQVTAKNEMADVLMGNSDNPYGAMIDLQNANLQMSYAKSATTEAVQGINQLLNMQI